MRISIFESYNAPMELDQIIKKVRSLGGSVFYVQGDRKIEIQCDSSKKQQVKEAIAKIKNP